MTCIYSTWARATGTRQYQANNTVLETWKKNAIEEAHELYTLKAHQSDYDVEVSDDEKKEIKKAAEKFMKAF